MSAPPTASEIELQSLVDVYDQPFAIVDRSYRVVAVNRAFEAAYGTPRASAKGSVCWSFVPPAKRPCPCARRGGDCPFPGVFEGRGSQTLAHTYLDSEGREHLVRIQASPIRTASGEILLGELVQLDSVRQHPGREAGQALEPMVGASPAFRALLGQILVAARSPAPVLLLGETGTGKELAAAEIHRLSERQGGPFQVLDCTGFNDALFESEVFGHERGAFTGAVGERPGLFELADGGTLFVDEVGELPLAQQAKLLRVLESGEYRRVGGTRTRRAEVRLIFATNRELRGVPWFRQDLYYRISCLPIVLPPLRERRGDLPALAHELLGRIGRSAGRAFAIDGEALALLMDYDFPGNVRELRNLLWVAAVNAEGGRILPRHLAAALPAPSAGPALEALGCGLGAAPAGGPLSVPLPRAVPQADPRSPRAAWEAERLAQVLARHGGNRRAAAEELKVSERTLYRMIRRGGLS